MKIRERHPQTAVLLLSQYVETTHALSLMEHGAARIGYLLKDRVSDVREFVESVRAWARVGPRSIPRSLPSWSYVAGT